MTQTEVPEYDQKILDVTKQLCQELDISNYNPTFVSWEALDSRVRVPVGFRYDDCLIDRFCLTLSAKMKEVLEPDEFEPIIASSLIFSKKLRKRILQQIGIALAGLVALALIQLYALPLLLPEPFTATKSGSTYTGTVGGAFAPITAFTLTIMGTVIVSVVIMRRTRRLADRIAADTVSGAAFLAILNKAVDMMRKSEYRPSRNVRGPIMLLPDIQTRIRLLQDYTQKSMA